MDIFATAGLIVTAAALLFAILQWLEARRQTAISVSHTDHYLNIKSVERMKKTLYPLQRSIELFNDFEHFKDVPLEWCPEMVVIPAGVFLMGSPEGEGGRFDDERPRHLVKIKQRFAIGRYPVTFDQFDSFCEDTNRAKPNDEGWGRGNLPVINVSWEDAHDYLDWLSKKTGKYYRLPTEAEWEYTCRANTTSKFSTGDVMHENKANYSRSRHGKTTEVGLYEANDFTVSDMHGNVWEWCFDGKRTYTDQEIENPIGPIDYSAYRVTRGGSWSVSARYLRCAFRHSDATSYRADDIGFRCARTID